MKRYIVSLIDRIRHLFSQKSTPYGDAPSTQNAQTTFVLVHCAWLGAWQWTKVIDFLEAQGHKVICPELPGHGADETPAAEIDMPSYLTTITDVLDAQLEPVILLGHSFNGITITQVAELRPEKIQCLVYLAGLLLPDGGSFLKTSDKFKNSVAIENLYLSDDKHSALIKEEQLQKAFAEDISEEVFVEVKTLIRAEPSSPLTYSLDLSRHQSAFDKYYIETTLDQAIPIEAQREMYDGNVIKAYRLESSHTPNFSQPKPLACMLMDLAMVSPYKKQINDIKQRYLDTPNLKVHRLFHQGNQLLAHFELEDYPNKVACIELFEFDLTAANDHQGPSEETKIIFSLTQDVPKHEKSENIMFNGVKTFTENGKTEKNRSIITRFLQEIWIHRNIDQLDNFFDDGKLIQHNPTIDDDIKGLTQFMQTATTNLQYQEVITNFAAGNFVLTYSKGLLDNVPFLFADLFRLEQGKIVEHWDVMQPETL